VGQAIADEQWFADIAEIYAGYDIYHQSGGQEQHVFDASSGRMRARSEVLLERLKTSHNIPHRGRVLDVGCGNGETLKQFSRTGVWELHGLDIHDRNRMRLAEIPGFAELHTCAPGDLEESFELITLIHALEHIPDPAGVLRSLKGKLRPNGVVFIQVPDASANPFDYVIADHFLHFSPDTLGILLRRAGFSRLEISTDWVAKEISLLAWADPTHGEMAPAAPSGGNPAAECVSWLTRTIHAARTAAHGAHCYGLFGSSIAATWLWSSITQEVQFFVDEDPGRWNGTHLERPILHPDQVPAGAVVFLGMAPALAALVEKRHCGRSYRVLLPPPLRTGPAAEVTSGQNS
jgi:SAM-dependent methyltransferase